MFLNKKQQVHWNSFLYFFLNRLKKQKKEEFYRLEGVVFTCIINKNEINGQKNRKYLVIYLKSMY